MQGGDEIALDLVTCVELCAVSDIRSPTRVALVPTRARYPRTHSSMARAAVSGRACPDEDWTGSDGARARETFLGASGHGGGCEHLLTALCDAGNGTYRSFWSRVDQGVDAM